MASEWPITSIGALCDAGVAELQTGPFGSQLHAHDYVAVGVPVVPTEAIRDRRIDHSVLPSIAPAKAAELARHKLQGGDILFARRGVQATGHVACVRNAEDGFLCGTGAIRLRVDSARGAIDPGYLSHVLANPASTDWFKFHAIGATMPNLNEGIIRSFHFGLPPIAVQRAIAHILGTLDDKVELNRRTSETLEAMARALFKSWFVDFDPVCAKLDGRWQRGRSLSGLPAHLYDLFPDRLVHSAVGGIPEGWKVGNFGYVVEQFREQVNPTASSELAFAHFSLPAFDRDQRPTIEFGRDIKSNKWRVLPRCVLLSKLNPEIERVWLVDVEASDNAIGSTEFLVLVPRAPFARSYVYCLARSAPFRQQMESLVTGTSKSHQRAQPSAVMESPVVIPWSPILDAFENVTEGWLSRVLVNRRESRILAAFRDALLPKLISGELRVKDAEKFVERATA